MTYQSEYRNRHYGFKGTKLVSHCKSIRVRDYSRDTHKENQYLVAPALVVDVELALLDVLVVAEEAPVVAVEDIH